MPIVAPTYLVDSSSQQWLIACDNNGLIQITAVSGKIAFSALFLTDITTSQI